MAEVRASDLRFTPDEAAASAKTAVDKGYTALKFTPTPGEWWLERYPGFIRGCICLGFDSLGRGELVARIEAAFDVTLPDQVLASAETPRDLLRAVLGAAGRRQAPGHPLDLRPTSPSAGQTRRS